MKTRVLFALLLATTPLFAQFDPMRNVSGTTPVTGGAPWIGGTSDAWSMFHGYAAHLTYASQTGPEEQINEFFSTNWLVLGVSRSIGDRGFLILRGRASAEPFTIPDDDGYPQLLQYVGFETGGPLIDRMRPHDLIGEAAVHVGFRPTDGTLVHLYGALVGDPAFGTAPYALRPTGVDFAEAPFAYDIQESTHDSTSVVTLGFNMSKLSLEGSVFHDAVTTGEHTEIDSGDIDSRSARLTLALSQNLIAQISRAELGEDAAKRDLSSASLSYSTPKTATTLLWTRREREAGPSETAYGFEVLLRGGRHTFMGRAEWADRPGDFPEAIVLSETEQTTHFAVGYVYDIMSSNRFRGGIGVNVDYHTQSHELPEEIYGHKPQSIYAFVRFRTMPQ